MARVEVANSGDVQESKVHATQAAGMRVILTRVQGKVFAIENRCPHLGLSMARGKLTGTALQCPWHGSKFDVCTGKNLDWVNSLVGIPLPAWSHGVLSMGKKPGDVRSLKADEVGGRVYLELPESA